MRPSVVQVPYLQNFNLAVQPSRYQNLLAEEPRIDVSVQKQGNLRTNTFNLPFLSSQAAPVVKELSGTYINNNGQQVRYRYIEEVVRRNY